MDHFFFWLVAGLLAGILAKALVPGNTSSGLIRDITVGMFGALIGGWLFQLMLSRYSLIWIDSTVASFIVAIGVLGMGRVIRRLTAW